MTHRRRTSLPTWLVRSIGPVCILAVVAAVALSATGTGWAFAQGTPGIATPGPGTPAAATPMVGTPVATPTENVASIRVVHASPDAGPVEVYVDGVLAVPTLQFQSATEFAAVPAGDHEIKIAPAGAGVGAAVFTGTASLEGDKAYELAAIGPLAQLQFGQFEVNRGPLEPNSARVRAVNAASGVDVVDVAQVGGAVLIEDVTYPGASDYTGVTVGQLALELRSNDGASLYQVPPFDVQAGQVIDVFVTIDPTTNAPAVFTVGTTAEAE